MAVSETHLFENKCPYCKKSPIFYGGVFMHRKCPSCGHVYEREPGYFVGAMVMSYLLGAFSTVPTVVIGIMILHAEVLSVVFAAIAQLVIFCPLLIRFSRLLWIQIDARAQRKIDRDEAKRSG